jgi:mannitol-specific phosphotransferase system IIBC component
MVLGLRFEVDITIVIARSNSMIFSYGIFIQSVICKFQRVGNDSLVARSNAVSTSKVTKIRKITAITNNRTVIVINRNKLFCRSSTGRGTSCRFNTMMQSEFKTSYLLS